MRGGTSAVEGRARPASRLVSVIFPPAPRTFRGRRGLKMLLRAAHVLCSGVLVGSFLFPAGAAARHGWLAAAVLSGLLILVLDLHESAVFLLQVRGLVVLAKIVLVVLATLAGFAGVWILSALVLVSVLVSHAPARVRYHVTVGGGRLRGSETKG